MTHNNPIKSGATKNPRFIDEELRHTRLSNLPKTTELLKGRAESETGILGPYLAFWTWRPNRGPLKDAWRASQSDTASAPRTCAEGDPSQGQEFPQTQMYVQEIVSL